MPTLETLETRTKNNSGEERNKNKGRSLSNELLLRRKRLAADKEISCVTSGEVIKKKKINHRTGLKV